MRGESGFNLVELTITMAVLGVLMGGVFGMLFRSQTTFELQQADQGVRQQARVAMDLVSTELRLAGYDLGNLVDPITRAGNDVIQFVGDIDDGDPGAPCGAAAEAAAGGGAERLTYELVNGDLLRSVDCWDGAAWSTELTDQVLAANVLNARALFRYFDRDGTELIAVGAELSAAQRAETRAVSIDFSLLDPRDLEDGLPAAFEITGRVHLPNLD